MITENELDPWKMTLRQYETVIIRATMHECNCTRRAAAKCRRPAAEWRESINAAIMHRHTIPARVCDSFAREYGEDWARTFFRDASRLGLFDAGYAWPSVRKANRETLEHWRAVRRNLRGRCANSGSTR